MNNPSPRKDSQPTSPEGEGFAWLPDRSFEPVTSLRRHFRLAVALWVVVILLGLPVALIKGKHTYLAEAAVRVSRTFINNLKSDDEMRFNSNSDYRQFVQQQVREITSYDVALTTLDLLGTDATSWENPEETRRRAAERLMAALKVRPIPDTYLITIGLEGEKPDSLDVIVNAVTEAYLEKQKEEEIYDPERRIAQLIAQQQETDEEVRVSTQQQSRIAQDLGVTGFVENFQNPYDQILSNSTDAHARARRQRIAAQGKLTAFEQHLERTRELEVDSAARRILNADRELLSVKGVLLKRRAELVLQTSNLTDRHPGRATLQRELNAIDSELDSLTNQTLGNLRKMLLQERATKGADERSKVRAELDEALRVEQGLSDEVEALREKVAWFATRYHEALDLQRNIERDRDRLETIEDRVRFLQLESQAPGFVRLASPARPAQIPISGGRRMWLLLVLVAATAIALCATMAVDRLDPRIHTPEELESFLRIAPLGWLPEESESADPAVASAQRRRLALTIERDMRDNGTRSFVLTPVERASGTSKLIFDVAGELNRLGVRTLAIDADPFSPDARFAGAKVGGGLAEVLAGSSELSEVIAPRTSELPDRIKLGASGPEFRIPNQEALQGVLEASRRSHDVVLIDAPPLRLLPDGAMLTRSVDAVLLVVEAATVYRSKVRESVELLESLTPGAFGAILNRVRTEGKNGYASDVIREWRSSEKARHWLGARWFWSWR